ncbi:hypothetical protein GOV04_04205 [Candidatus Woesearchaeota archaeon]|nr:hypothetical protein [Candidatus Woesearchaeota archaeon]
MKKILIALVAIMIALSASVAFAGGGQTKAKLGPCVKDCVQAYNPTLADADAEFFLVAETYQQGCVDYCKVLTTEGACLGTKDDCCNVYEQETDWEDCGLEDPNTCSVHADCETTEYCATDSSCQAKLGAGQLCDFDEQCVDNTCDQSTVSGFAC